MLKLSLDTTNSINICQEEIYHPTTAGSKASILLPDSRLRGRHCGSDWRQADGFTSMCLPLFSLQILHIDIFINKIYLFVMISHTSACVPRVDWLFLSLPVMKVLELLPGSLPDCCFIIESSIDNIWIQIWQLWFTEPRHYQMLLFPPAGRPRRTITFSVFFFLFFFNGNLNMAPLRKSFCSPNPQQAFTARQHDLVNPELFYVPIVCVDRWKKEWENRYKQRDGRLRRRSLCLSELSNTKKNEHLCWSTIISPRLQIHHTAETEQ